MKSSPPEGWNFLAQIVATMTIRINTIILMRRAGFEPADPYGNGP